MGIVRHGRLRPLSVLGETDPDVLTIIPGVRESPRLSDQSRVRPGGVGLAERLGTQDVTPLSPKFRHLIAGWRTKG